MTAVFLFLGYLLIILLPCIYANRRQAFFPWDALPLVLAPLFLVTLEALHFFQDANGTDSAFFALVVSPTALLAATYFRIFLINRLFTARYLVSSLISFFILTFIFPLFWGLANLVS